MEPAGEVGDGQVSAGDVELWRHRRGKMASWSTATGGARTRVRVWRVPGGVAELNL
jgi:hypothetical protein